MPDAPRRPGPSRPQRRAQRQAQLLDNTVALIRREGPLVSMDRIAAECGVTKPIIYRYFGDREGLVKEVACRLVADFSREMHEATLGLVGPREHLAATLDAYLRVVERETNLYRFLNHHTSVERRDVFGRLVAEQFALAFEKWLQGTSTPATATRTWAQALVGILHVVSDWWTAEHALARAELVEHLMALVWDGLAHVPIDRDRTR